MTQIQGTCDERFEKVYEALAGTLEDEDVGACAAVFLDGEPVVDLWGGYVDAKRTAVWREDTITSVFSTTKTMTALCALILADRGELDLYAPVARYWPQFAAAGKSGIEVRHVLAHTAGLPDFDGPLAVADLYDWDACTARLAAQTPRWEPGMLAGYHSVTQGFLVGEVIRRITGASVGEFFAAQVAGPLGADFHIGLGAEHDHRVAPLLAPESSPDGDWVASAPGGGPGTDTGDSGGAAPVTAAATPASAPAPSAAIRLSDGNSVAWRRAQLPSVSGFGNARSVAAVQSVLANGGTSQGVRLLSEAGCAVAQQEQYRGVDHIIGASMRYGMGYGISDTGCFWGGWGGSMVMADLRARLSIAYVMNRMSDRPGLGDHRALGIVIAAYEGLEQARA
jgi:CubicO group peptidase (beta-lactamase class C family)